MQTWQSSLSKWKSHLRSTSRSRIPSFLQNLRIHPALKLFPKAPRLEVNLSKKWIWTSATVCRILSWPSFPRTKSWTLSYKSRGSSKGRQRTKFLFWNKWTKTLLSRSWKVRRSSLTLFFICKLCSRLSNMRSIWGSPFSPSCRGYHYKLPKGTLESIWWRCKSYWFRNSLRRQK
jgi:hypothetical protein